MNKLSMDALAQRANAIASDELLNTIAGGLASEVMSGCHTNDCHP